MIRACCLIGSPRECMTKECNHSICWKICLLGKCKAFILIRKSSSIIEIRSCRFTRCVISSAIYKPCCSKRAFVLKTTITECSIRCTLAIGDIYNHISTSVSAPRQCHIRIVCTQLIVGITAVSIVPWERICSCTCSICRKFYVALPTTTPVDCRPLNIQRDITITIRCRSREYYRHLIRTTGCDICTDIFLSNDVNIVKHGGIFRIILLDINNSMSITIRTNRKQDK